MGRLARIALFASASAAAVAGSARADVIRIGPGKKYRELTEVAEQLKPGDVVEVQGNARYKAVKFWNAGTPDKKIVIRGIRVDGKRPVVEGGDWTVSFNGSHHMVFEGFEVTGGEQVCLRHMANDITVRDTVVHHCKRHGILGADEQSGTLLLDHVEVDHAGGKFDNESTKHPVYIATDSEAFPGSVFRMEQCYIHHSTGGNSVKSRAERTELYYNWIEGGTLYEVELIGPGRCGGVREDGDVVGNVMVQTPEHTSGVYITRVGGDGTGETCGRYRFVNNLMVTRADVEGPMRCHDGIESIELHNNVLFKLGGAAFKYLVRTSECTWTQGEQIFGSNNWVTDGTPIPSGLRGTLVGTDPGFADANAFDFRITKAGPLVDAGTSDTAVKGELAFPRPLALPAFLPPPRALLAVGKALKREKKGVIDIGPYEMGSTSDAPKTIDGDDLRVDEAPPPSRARTRRLMCASDGAAGAPGFLLVLAILALGWRGRRR